LDAERRKSETYVRVAASERPTTVRPFDDLGLTGHEFRVDGSQWKRCNAPEEFADYLEAESERRSWFVDETQRRGKPIRMKRPAGTPVEIVTTTFPPWLSNWVLAELRAGRDPRPQLVGIRAQWLTAATRLLQGQRFILGFAFHADTDDLHFDLCITRQDGEGWRIGQSGLGLVGPWCVGTDRQVRAGAVIAQQKREQLSRSVANFRRRNGADAIPFDVQLARAFDAASDEIIGPVLKLFKAAYGATVPTLERLHAEAEMAALDAARQRIKERLPRHQRNTDPTSPEMDL
jgi:hypothetical protein